MINSDLIATIQKRLDDDGTEFDAPSVLRELRNAGNQLAQDEIIRDALLPEVDTTSITLVGDTDNYALPSNYNHKVHRVVLNPASVNSRKLMPVSLEELYDQQYNYQGSLNYYSIRGNRIYFAGVPSATDVGAVIQIWYAKKDDDYQNNGAETQIGKHIPHILMDLVCHNLLLTSPDLAGIADRKYTTYEKALERAHAALDNPSGEPRFVESTSDWPIG